MLILEAARTILFFEFPRNMPGENSASVDFVRTPQESMELQAELAAE